VERVGRERRLSVGRLLAERLAQVEATQEGSTVRHITSVDVENERRSIRALMERGWDLVRHFPAGHVWDADMRRWDFYSGEWGTTFHFEFKRRHHRFGEYNTVLFDQPKADAMASLPGVSIYLATFDDASMLTRIDRRHLDTYHVERVSVRQGEQDVRQDPADADRPLYHIPIFRFHPLF
jgi:hypothetical protein